jgi:hypothetical protein
MADYAVRLAKNPHFLDWRCASFEVSLREAPQDEVFFSI